MEKSTRFGILHQAKICTESGSLYALRICAGMNAGKLAASMVSLRPTSNKAVRQRRLPGLCRLNNRNDCRRFRLALWPRVPQVVEICAHRHIAVSQNSQKQKKSKFDLVWRVLLITAVYCLHDLGFRIKHEEEQLAAPLASLTDI